MPSSTDVEPRFFPTPKAFRAWLKTHHAKAGELLVGFYKVGSGKPSMTWPESVDEALSFGWIDGVRRSLGEEAYTIRFTPRRKGSVWSAVNIKRVEVLQAEGRMSAAGIKAFEARLEHKSRVYAFEQGDVTLAPVYEKRIKANKAAWTHFSARTPSYRKKVIWWIMSAKAEETRQRRVEKLIESHSQEKLL
jgi:uncharacterized protein YdeI (YjbR/CyaY-like superfamily)